MTDCAICRGPDGDEELDRTEVWRDDQWRLSMSRHSPTLGFGYLEPIRHIPFLADLDPTAASGRDRPMTPATAMRVST